jgi:hypothetical protein
MMLTYRLVNLIETHSEELASSLLRKVQDSHSTRSYSEVPAHELERRVSEIYQHLGDWLLGKTELELSQRYQQIGARRCRQGVRLSELIWAIVLTKENLWDFLKREAAPDRPVEVFAELEILELLDQFFDRAIHYAAMGYEQASRAGQALEASVGKYN